MPTCQFEKCVLPPTGPTGNLCILHQQSRDKDIGMFTDQLASYAASGPRDSFRGVHFPAPFVFTQTNLENADFESACFYGDINFSRVHFGHASSFVDTRFHKDAIFSGAVFANGVSFEGTKFATKADFQGCHFGGRSIFSSGYHLGRDARIFQKCNDDGATRSSNPEECSVLVIFDNVTIGRGGSVSFRHADLRRCTLGDSDVDLFKLLDIMWPRLGGRHLIYDEVFSENRKTGTIPFGKLETTYRKVKKVYQDDGDFERASDFHYGEKEMRRRNRATNISLRILLSAYKYTSGYGEKYLRPLAWFGAILLFGAAAYLYFGISSADYGMGLQWRSYRHWGRVVLFGLRQMSFLRPEELSPIGGSGNLVQTLQALLGPIFLGLAALAIRQRLRR